MEPRRTPLSQSVSAFDVTISSLVGVAASLCFVNLRLLNRGLYLSLQSGFFTRTALRTVSLRFSSAGGCRLPSPMSARYLLVTCALAVRCRCCDHLMLVINLSSPTAVAGRILPANSSQTQCLQGFNPLVDRLSFEPFSGQLSSGEMYYTRPGYIRQPLFSNFSVFFRNIVIVKACLLYTSPSPRD